MHKRLNRNPFKKTNELKRIKRLIGLLATLLWGVGLSAQTLSGNLSLLANQTLQLDGFNGLKNYPISSNTMDANGNFTLHYTQADYGVGCLQIATEKPFFVLLTGEDIVLQGSSLNDPNTIHIIKGNENRFFEQYAQEQPKREQALSAWIYLEKMYQIDALFSVQLKPKNAIQQEKQRIKKEDATFLANLPKDSYVSWYLPTRKLVSSVSVVAQYRTEEIPSTITAFRNMDYTDPRLYKSGLFKDAIDNHFWLLENSGRSLDSSFIEMKISIDAMMKQLVKDEHKLNEVTDYLFDLLERHSLFQASEYLALKVLNEVSCTINNDLAKQLETYRAMKKGNIAPDLVFKGDIVFPSYTSSNIPQKLSDIKSKYTVVVFGASWCPKCTEEIPALAKLYAKWKAQDVAVVFVSLDVDKEAYTRFTKDFPFISTCDYKKWEGENVKAYYVFGTPTMFLLDSNREILLRPKSVQQMDAWVDWYLIQGNKQLK